MTSVQFGAHDEGEAVVVDLEGELDLSNIAAVSEQITTAVNGAEALALDLSGIRYMDSSGVGLLFELVRKATLARQPFVIVVPERSPLRRLMAVTNLHATVPVTATVADALAQLRSMRDLRPENG